MSEPLQHQLHMFSPIKKAITKQRIEEARAMMNDPKQRAKGLRELNDMLEVVERRITN